MDNKLDCFQTIRFKNVFNKNCENLLNFTHNNRKLQNIVYIKNNRS